MADKILRGNFPGTLIFHVGDGDSKITITVTQTEDGALIEATDKNGATTAMIYNGKDGYTPQKGIDYVDGKDGSDGTSVTVESVSESIMPGGGNMVTFSDGKTVTILNGPKGATGEKGNGIAGVGYDLATDGTTNGFTLYMDDGTEFTYDIPQGPKGDKGDQGIQGPKGDTGKDGTSVTIDSVSESSVDGEYNTIYFSDGTELSVKNGSKGSNGTPVTVKSVSESTADGGSNVVTFSDGKTLTVKNGSKGRNGSDASVTSANIASALGYTPASQSDVEQKANKQGLSLGVGADGLVYIFVDGAAQGNGLDIKAETVAGDVVGYVDSNNTIILTGALANGTYTFKYVYADGKTTNIGSLTVSDGVELYKNMIPISTDTDGSVYNGKGYANNTRLSSSGGTTNASGFSVTGFIPFVNGNVLRSSEGMFNAADTSGYLRISYYDANKAYISEFKITANSLGSYGNFITITNGALYFNGDIKNLSNSDFANRTKFIRICASNIDDDSVITVNEEIV